MSPKQKPLQQKGSEVWLCPPETKRDDGRVTRGFYSRKAVAWVNSLNGWQYLLLCVVVLVILGMVTGGLDQSGLHPYARTP